MAEFSNNSVPKMYMGVVNEVIGQCKDAFTDEGFDEQTLVDLRNLWSRKLKDSGVLEQPVQMRQPMQYGSVRPGYRPVVTNQRSIQIRQGQGQPQQVQLVYPGVATPTQQQRRIIVQNVQNPNVQTRPVIYQNVVQGQIQQPQVIIIMQETRITTFSNLSIDLYKSQGVPGLSSSNTNL